ncbi:MAG: 50S ribosomal protein L3 [Patescibacteria group bacterium]|jgi:large subunit ribosomal protein L3
MDSFYTYKLGEMHAYDASGKRMLVTRLQAKPLTVAQVKTGEKDGYKALQVGIGEKKRLNKPQSGHLKKARIVPQYLREIKLSEDSEKKLSDEIKISEVFQVGDVIKVSGRTKGKGFTGAMKRHGFHGGPRTHGQSDRARAVGSIGQGTDPGRVWKGKKMAGRMGGSMLTILGSQIVKIDEIQNEIWITGSVPGAKGGLVKLIKVGNKKFSGLAGEKTETTKEENSEKA